ncbi:hypothetical protein Aab01nite_43100 [Paractinoplanes abujensis]|uniref:DMSO reductase anchor subunit n=1 Tax=Paractinoplanes abujensis TaxID=882441 RepID=A0A7W7CSR4_9ACTN|nr:hypothetical protein [Actinoplanes abujensis]MBB4694065.1 DMSO reductase anchor subunit [Actinoplanes abujensis]GID20720.1 hypothetical protein Aab01nite_43100 [Actinoplanes abujensis]
MENIERVPDANEAREALASIDVAQRAVRDTPWPTWIYPVNAVLLGGMALAALAPEHRRLTTLWAVALVVIAVNATVGYRMGTPWTWPTSRVFLASVVAAGACVAAAFVVTGHTALTVALAVAAAALYLAGSVAHRRSTGRPR